MIRYIVRYVRGKKEVRSGNSFMPCDDGLQIIKYYAAPLVAKGGRLSGWRVEYAQCVYDDNLSVEEQTPITAWRRVEVG